MRDEFDFETAMRLVERYQQQFLLISMIPEVGAAFVEQVWVGGGTGGA